MSENLILSTDSYKLGHYKQYPDGSQKVYSYFESRGGLFKQTVFFGLQYIIKKHLEGQVITKEKIDEARKISHSHFGTDAIFNFSGWTSILKKFDGRLPVTIKAVPEGCIVPVSNVLMTVENNDDEFFWLTNYLETLLCQVWYPTTVATLSREIKKLLLVYLHETGNPDLVDFKLHDFGFRGATCYESSAIGGLAHLVNFKGTDTMSALTLARDYYNAQEIAGYSIPASEHSTITSWGKTREVMAYSNMLRQYADSPFIACVSDSYDIYHACEAIWGNILKADVERLKGTLVIRPDSGNPTEVVLKVLNILGDKFGYSTNEKGYKVLNPKVRVIQGDGVDYDSIHEILEYMRVANWSADNIAFGMGGALLQKVNRDTQKFAFKCSNIMINNVNHDVFKDPVTDSGKRSKRGKLKLSLLHDTAGAFYETISSSTANFEQFNDVLKDVFVDGRLVREYSLDGVRENTIKDTMYYDMPSFF